MRSRLLLALVVSALLTLVALGQMPAAATHGGDTEVTVGSNDLVFSQNKQNEPAVAIDPMHPNVVAAGANDNIDMEACNVGPDTDCPFTPDVGGSGIYFSFDSGDTWTQPTYTGWTARDCLGIPGDEPNPCKPHAGPIGTLPRYFENGLVSDGDPALAFGPRADASGTFSWANGSRLYYANLVSNFTGAAAFKGIEGIAVSRTDDIAGAAAGRNSAWMDPVIASKQASATFSDKEQIWADNAASSPHFGNVYVCYAKFSGGAAPMTVAVSRDGGETWANRQVSPGHNVAPGRWGQSGCTVRTDSRGVVYVFYEQFQNPSFFFPPVGTHFMVKSFDGGVSWTRPRPLGRAADPCYQLQWDGTTLRCVQDGLAGARNDLSAAPSVSISNGTPTGAGATDFMVLTWAGFDTNGVEHVYVRWSADRGATWSDPVAVETAGDRGYYSAPALSPDGRDLYLVYNAFTTPFRNNTTSPRGLVGVVKHADVVGGALANWTTLHRGTVGDPRGSAQNNIILEFLGDYVYVAATDAYAVAVWNDARSASPCDAVNTWRPTVQETRSVAGRPEIQKVCAATFGNTDIFGGSYADPNTP